MPDMACSLGQQPQQASQPCMRQQVCLLSLSAHAPLLGLARTPTQLCKPSSQLAAAGNRMILQPTNQASGDHVRISSPRSHHKCSTFRSLQYIIIKTCITHFERHIEKQGWKHKYPACSHHENEEFMLYAHSHHHCGTWGFTNSIYTSRLPRVCQTQGQTFLCRIPDQTFFSDEPAINSKNGASTVLHALHMHPKALQLKC